MTSYNFNLLIWLVIFIQSVRTDILTPPYFNLAANKSITATATCGEGAKDGRELYCKLTSSTNSQRETNFETIKVRNKRLFDLFYW